MDASAKGVPLRSEPLAAGWVDNNERELKQGIGNISGWFADRSHRVDEYQPSGTVSESVTSITTTPEFEFSTLVETVIVTGPQGNTAEIAVPNPAAGASAVYTVTQPITLQSIFATFTADATVSNRFLQFVIKDASGNVVIEGQNNSAVVASTSL